MPFALSVKRTGPCPKCQGTNIRAYGSVRARGGPLPIGDLAADAFTVFSRFDADACITCGYTEFYLKSGVSAHVRGVTRAGS